MELVFVHPYRGARRSRGRCCRWRRSGCASAGRGACGPRSASRRRPQAAPPARAARSPPSRRSSGPRARSRCSSAASRSTPARTPRRTSSSTSLARCSRRRGAASPTRLERAVTAARRLRAAIPDVPVGLASFTNRVVPHIFPTLDRAVFGSGLRALDRDRAAAAGRRRGGAADRVRRARATADARLLRPPDTAPGRRRPHRRRDAAGVGGDDARAPRRAPARPADRPRLARGRADPPRPRADRRRLPARPASTGLLRSFATATGARVYDEGAVGERRGSCAGWSGAASACEVGTEQSSRPLTAWTLALALVPLGYLLWRRNVAISFVSRRPR